MQNRTFVKKKIASENFKFFFFYYAFISKDAS